MARKKKQAADIESNSQSKTMKMPGTMGGANIVFPKDPVVIQGSHSVRTEYPDGRVEFVIDYDKLLLDVKETLSQSDHLDNLPLDPAVTTVNETTRKKRTRRKN